MLALTSSMPYKAPSSTGALDMGAHCAWGGTRGLPVPDTVPEVHHHLEPYPASFVRAFLARGASYDANVQDECLFPGAWYRAGGGS